MWSSAMTCSLPQILPTPLGTAGNTISNLALFAGAVLLASLPPSSSTLTWNVTQLPAGDYKLIAVAMQVSGATNASAPVGISVVAPAAITLQDVSRAAPGGFQFSYSSTAGLSYVVQHSADLSSWLPVATNTANASLSTFVD